MHLRIASPSACASSGTAPKSRTKNLAIPLADGLSHAVSIAAQTNKTVKAGMDGTGTECDGLPKKS
jgi:hypothetical protein